MKKFTKKQEIEILEVTLENFDDWYFDNGTCYLLNKAYCKISNSVYLEYQVCYQIKSFNRRRAFALSKKYNFELPFSIKDNFEYWWVTSDTVNRKLFLKYLIQELKNK